jgi:hypothetical protein
MGHGAEGMGLKKRYDIGLDIFNAMRFALCAMLNQ